MPPGSPQLSPQRSRPLVTAFPSPITAAAFLRPPFRGQWSRPATSWPASRLPRPVRLWLPHHNRFAPGCGGFFASARCASACRLARLLPLPPLPSGTFTSLGIEAFSSFRRLAAHLPATPDFLSLPAAGSISRVGDGSTFLVRYVSEGLLFLKTSWNLLHYALNHLFRQSLSGLGKYLFLSIYFIYFQAVTQG